MTATFFVTGTDTNIGKTTSIVALINFLQNNNKTVLGLKPLATDCFEDNKILYNNDALQLQQASGLLPEYSHINPFRFQQPVSPHIVNNLDRVITSDDIIKHCAKAIDIYQPDYCLIEGAGGWLCPLNNIEDFSDIALKLDAPIILTVGIKLGCLNHSLLTVESILTKKLNLHGWIANCLEPEFDNQANIDYLKNKIAAPLLGTIDYQATDVQFSNLL